MSFDMARSLRIEKANGVYRVINRGNYRQDLFINEGAHLAFEGRSQGTGSLQIRLIAD